MLYNKSIKNRLVIGFAVILVFVILASAGITFHRGIQLTSKLLGQQALTSAQQAIKLVDVSKLEKVISTMKDNSPEYLELQRSLAEYRKGLGLEYLYTMTKTSDGKYMYLVDGMYMTDEGFSKLGDIEEDSAYYAQYDKVFNGEIVTNSITFELQWGDLVSAYIPIKDESGKVIAFLGLDLKADHVLSMIRSNTYMTLTMILLIFVISVFAASFVALKSVNPLVHLRDHFTSLGDAEIKPYDTASRDEVGDLAKILNKNMDSVRTILNNTGEGLLTFGPKLVPNREYSNECKTIFNQENLEYFRFPELLHPNNPEEQYMTASILTRIFTEGNEVRQRSYISLLPHEVVLNGRYIRLEYKVIEQTPVKPPIKRTMEKKAVKAALKGVVEKSEPKHIIMVIARDITDRKNLEQKIDQERKLLDMVVNLLVHINDITDLMQVYRNFCNHELWSLLDSHRSDEEILYDVFREIHTFKGDFGVYKLCSMVDKLHAVEDYIMEAQKNGNRLTKDKLKKYFLELNPAGFMDDDMNTVRGIVGDNVVDRVMGMEKSILIDYSRLKAVEEVLLAKFGEADGIRAVMEIRKLRYRYFNDLLKSYPEYVERVGERLQKLVYFNIGDDGDFLVDTEIYKDFTDSLVHIFRNSVDHGIEDPEERIQLGKDEYGCISCRVEKGNDKIKIEISDDGRGLDLVKIRSKAVQRGMLTKAEAKKMSEQESIKLIFRDELSTKDEVTVISGRGMGLSAFIAELNKLNGNVHVTTKQGVGTSFHIEVPHFEKIIESNCDL